MDQPVNVWVENVRIGTLDLCVSDDARRQGLLGRKDLARDEGILMVMPRGRRMKRGFMTSIHMLFMRFPIAAAWLDDRGMIVYSVEARPWRYYASPKPASFILEVHPVWLPGLRAGGQVRVTGTTEPLFVGDEN